MSTKLRYELMIAADMLMPGEIMEQAYAEMSWERLACMICCGQNATLPRLAIVAVKLAEQLDSLERK